MSKLKAHGSVVAQLEYERSGGIPKGNGIVKAFLSITLAGIALAIGLLPVAAAPLPKFNHLPNFLTPKKCDPFAWGALRHLQTNGIAAHRVCYGWKQMTGLSGFHAAIFFQWEGKVYFMDNDRATPRLVTGKTDLACVNQISADFYTRCWIIDEANRRIAPRRMSDIFKAEAPSVLETLREVRP